ncbi:HAMP domain-containing protein [Acidaminobacter sp. JC074]|uniref:HAMP domain-containing protein n=1 Tax=Acidaminobacter sp. JC074 TaxID=2530199 RepID=UPI001F0E699A|nr:HAMP domain-containing protein [Acidaminobacter sp. JC074]
MKTKSLFTRSMLWIVVPTIIISLILMIVLQSVIKDYFRQDSYNRLDSEIGRLRGIDQDKIESSVISPVKDRIASALAIRVLPSKQVNSTFVLKKNDGSYEVLARDLGFLEAVIQEIDVTQDMPFHGETVFEEENVFYAVAQYDQLIEEKRLPSKDVASVYYVTYISEKYSIELTQNVMLTFAVGLSVLLIIVITILFFVFRSIGNRLGHLEDGTKKIGEGDFNTVIKSTPKDEIGRLGDAMNRMGRQLSLIQEEQAENFQIISHELKTPIMVLQGYMDALIHHQYPNGTPEASYEIIMKELDKLENLTKDLIILNKSDYLARNNVSMASLKLEDLFEKAVETLNNRQLDVVIEGYHHLTGDYESWMRIVENILTNQMRYAKSKIIIKLGDSIMIENDGDQIDPFILSNIKKPFVKGKEGRSGLGLAIINNTLKLYHYELYIENTPMGVRYMITKEVH